MQRQLEVPRLPTGLISDTTLPDEEFECLAMTDSRPLALLSPGAESELVDFL